jgi:hypothetical protein
MTSIMFSADLAHVRRTRLSGTSLHVRVVRLSGELTDGGDWPHNQTPLRSRP